VSRCMRCSYILGKVKTEKSVPIKIIIKLLSYCFNEVITELCVMFTGGKKQTVQNKGSNRAQGDDPVREETEMMISACMFILDCYINVYSVS